MFGTFIEENEVAEKLRSFVSRYNIFLEANEVTENLETFS